MFKLTVISYILKRPDCTECCLSKDPDDNLNSYKVNQIMDAKDNFVSSSSMNVAEDDESEPDTV